MESVIATVYIPNGVSKAVRTFPGHTLKFVGGKAEVRAEWDMPSVLAMPDARVQVSKDWAEWLPKWIDQMPGFEDKVRATVEVMGFDETPAEAIPMSVLDLDEIVHAKHPKGHQCRLCVARRERVSAAMQAIPTPA